MTERRTAQAAAGAATEPVARLADDFAAIGRQEAATLRDDALTALTGAASGTSLLIAGGAAAVLGAAMASTALLRALESRLSPPWAAAVLSAGYLGVAAATTAVGVRELRAAGGGAGRLGDQITNQAAVLARRFTGQLRRGYRPRAEPEARGR